MKAREWVTFLRIPAPGTWDKVPALDPGWCAAVGVNPGAEVVLRLLKEEVLPFVRLLEKHGLQSYHFLVHDRHSGVPTTIEDNSPYIHLRLLFKKLIDLEQLVPIRWSMTRPLSGEQESIGGIDGRLVSAFKAREILDAQSRWVLALLEEHTWEDDALMVRQVRQFLHYFANMTQMKVIG